MNEQNESGTGSVVGIVIVILILVVGGIYFFNQRIERQKQVSDTMSDSDYISIQAEASAMNYDNLGAGVDQLQ